jgi:hypothetical protein
LVKLGVALVFALVAAGAAALVYGKRDFLFEWDWAKTHGTFEAGVPPALVASARDLAEAKHPGAACVAKGLGHDDKFVFLAVGCGRYPENGEAPLAAARARYSGEQASSLEIPSREAYPNSIRRIFPLRAFEALRAGFPKSEILQEGLARMREKGLAPR